MQRVLLVRLHRRHDSLQRAVGLDQLQGRFGSNALHRVAVIAPAQNTQVHKLLIGHVESRKYHLQIDLDDGLLVARTEGHLAEELRGPVGECVHVFGARGIHAASLGQLRTLRLCLARGLDHWHAHEPQQLLAVVVMLTGYFHESTGEFVDVLGSIRLRRDEARKMMRVEERSGAKYQTNTVNN